MGKRRVTERLEWNGGSLVYEGSWKGGGIRAR